MSEPPVFAAFSIPIGSTDLERIGTLCVLWSQVEYLVEAGIYSVQGINFMTGRQTVLPRDISKKAGKLAALVGEACEVNERKDFTALCDRVIALAPLRNLAIHGHWARVRSLDGAPAAVSWFKVPVDQQITRLMPDHLPDLIQEAGAISLGLYKLLMARGAFTIMAA